MGVGAPVLLEHKSLQREIWNGAFVWSPPCVTGAHFVSKETEMSPSSVDISERLLWVSRRVGRSDAPCAIHSSLNTFHLLGVPRNLLEA